MEISSVKHIYNYSLETEEEHISSLNECKGCNNLFSVNCCYPRNEFWIRHLNCCSLNCMMRMVEKNNSELTLKIEKGLDTLEEIRLSLKKVRERIDSINFS